ncbi:MAG TPA: Ig-like domain-containing protein [bacterium]|nr:Ig-like domain-containing protein [bacterium]HPN43845.1 Ig-like domain-containing protein [bacterium]
MYVFKKSIAFVFIITLVSLSFVLAATPPVHDNLLYSSNLQSSSDQNIGTLTNRAGQFISGQGWKATGQTSQLKIALPAELPYEGTMVIKVTNFDPVSQNVADKQHIINLYSRNDGKVNNSDPQGAWVNIRTGTGYSDGPGKAGFKFNSCSDGATNEREEVRAMQSATWDLGSTYEFKIVWTQANIFCLVNGVKKAESPFIGQVEKFRYIFLGTDNQYVGQPGPVYFDLKIYTSDEMVENNDLSFTNITYAAGVQGVKAVEKATDDPSDIKTFGHGVSFGDYNKDGFYDFVYTNAGALAMADVLYINKGNNTFTNASAARGVNDTGHTHGIVNADWDNDGDLDLFYSNQPVYVGDTSGRNRMYRNNGNGMFTEITTTCGLSSENSYSRGSVAVDMNNDGWLDLFVLNWGSTADTYNKINEVYLNDGDGTFTRVHNGCDGPTNDSVNYGRQGATAADIDNDGDQDIYMCRRGKVNWLYINDGTGNFTEGAAERGIACTDGVRHHGATFVDIDNDGDLDLFVMPYATPGQALPMLRVFKNNGSGYFTDETNSYNIRVSGYSTLFGDIDNDGDQDMFLLRNSEQDPGTVTKLYLNDGEGNLTYNRQPALEVDAGDVRGGAMGDIDNDGDLDMYMACSRGDNNFLFRNDLDSENHYVRVLCIGPAGDYGGFGSKVSVYAPGHMDDAAFLLGYQESVSNYSYLCQNQTALHFGLGPYTTCDIKVKFLNGITVRYPGVAGDTQLEAAPTLPVPTTLENITDTTVYCAAGQTAGDSIRVRITNNQSRVVENHPVSFTVTQGNGTLNGSSATMVNTNTNAYGMASVAWKPGTVAGAVNTLSVSSLYQEAPLANSPLLFTAVVSPGSDTLLQKQSGDNQFAASGIPLPDSIKVFVHDQYNNPQPNTAIRFQVLTGNGNIGGNTSKTVITNTAGMAAVQWTPGSAEGINAHTLQASLLSNPSTQVVFYASTSQAPIKDLLLVSGNNQTGTVGTQLGSPFVVQLLDSLGIPRSGFSIKFKVLSGGGLLEGTSERTVLTGTNGKAQVFLTLGQIAGNENQAVSATCSEINDVVHFTATATADVPVLLEKTVGDNQGGSLYQVLPVPLTVKITDKYTNPVGGQPVTFSVVNNNGTVNDQPTVTVATDAQGLAKATFRLGQTAGAYYVNVSSTWNNVQLSGSPAIFTASATTDPTRLVYVSGDSSTGVINSVLPVPLQVKVTDEHGYPVSGFNVLFVSASGGGTFDGNLQIQQPTNSQGVASVYPTLGNRVGKNVYVFNAGAFGDAGEHLKGSPIVFNVSAQKSAADKIVLIAGNNQSGQAGEFLSSSLQVAARGPDNANIPNHDITFTVFKGNGKLGNSQVNTLTIKTDAQGIAKTEFRLGSDIGTNTDIVQVTADNGLTSLTNSPLTITASASYGQADPAASLITISDSVVPADGLSQLVVTVQLKDKNNNPVPGENVIVQVSGAGNTITQPAQVTNAGGLATARVTSTQAGQKIVSAQVANKNIILQQTKTVDFTAGPAQNIVIVSGNNQSGAINSSLPAPLTVRITDAQGNPVYNHFVTFTVASGGGIITTAQPVFTDNNGLANSVWILGPSVGEQTVQVSALNITGTVQFKAQAGIPAIASLHKVKGDEQFTSPGALFPDSLVVRVVDGNQSPVSAIPVIFSIEQGDASLNNSSHVNSDSYGLARVRLAAGNLPGMVRVKAAINETLFVEFNCSVSVSLPDTIIHVLGNGSEGTVGSTIYPLTVKALDADKNPISGVAITFAAGDPLAAIEELQPIRTGANGMASAHARLGTRAGAYIFTATNDRMKGSPVIFRVNAVPDNAVNMLITAGNNQTGDPLEFLPQPLQVRIVDTWGNGVPEVAVTFSVTSGNGKMSNVQPVLTDSSGLANCLWQLGAAGLQTVTVTSPVLPQKSFQFSATLRENLLPDIHVVADTLVEESTTLVFTVSATDPEGGQVMLSVIQKPTAALFDSVETGQFSWTPNYNDQGDHTVIFRAADENGGVATKTMVIHVINVNRKPGVVSTSPKQTTVSAEFNKIAVFEVSVADADKDPLFYRWTVNNNYIKSQDDSNHISIMPNKTWPQQFSVHVLITDKMDTISHTWNVSIIQTKVELSSFAATADKDQITITWQTRNAVNTAGFYVQQATRSEGPYTRRNDNLIRFDKSNNFEYRDTADNGCRDYYYRLEEITVDGESFTFDPVRVRITVPAENRLLQNYPNPFNPVTTLKYELKNRQHIEINIFNISGQLIKTLYSGDQETGYHQLIWNGRNDGDMPVASGLYYCCMAGDHYRHTIKLLLLK